jgi:hypothetical protein
MSDRDTQPDYVVKLHDPRSSDKGNTIVGAAWIQEGHPEDDETIRVKFRAGMAISTEHASLILAPWRPEDRKGRAERPPIERTYRR